MQAKKCRKNQQLPSAYVCMRNDSTMLVIFIRSCQIERAELAITLRLSEFHQRSAVGRRLLMVQS